MTNDDGVQVDAILIDQSEFGEAARQRRARDFNLPRAVGLQRADRARKIARNQPGVGADREQRARHDPFRLVPPCLAPPEVARRWATLPQQIFEVDPLACPTCRGPLRIIAFITQALAIDQILTHLRSHAAHAGARSPPSTRALASREASRAPRPYADAPTAPTAS